MTRGFARPADTETYVIETADPYDTHGQVELVNFHDGAGWLVWRAPIAMPRALQNEIRDARNAPRSYTITRI